MLGYESELWCDSFKFAGEIAFFVLVSWFFAFVIVQWIADFCCWLIYALAGTVNDNDPDDDDASV